MSETSERMTPNPEVWITCSVCDVAYVLRRCLSFSEGWVWCWQQDCEKPRSQCKGAAPVLTNADGPLEQAPELAKRAEQHG